MSVFVVYYMDVLIFIRWQADSNQQCGKTYWRNEGVGKFVILNYNIVDKVLVLSGV